MNNNISSITITTGALSGGSVAGTIETSGTHTPAFLGSIKLNILEAMSSWIGIDFKWLVLVVLGAIIGATVSFFVTYFLKKIFLKKKH
jgi:hypothetical protein